jgi:SAM-dependent methyltransferase
MAERSGPILDLGCGYGRHVTYAAEQGLKVLGIDFSGQALHGAKQRVDRARQPGAWLLQAEFSHLPLESGSLAGAMSIQAIYHAPRDHILASLLELRRVLMPGGNALINFLSDRNSYFGKGEQMEPKTHRLPGGVDDGAPHHFFNQSDIQRICAEAGLLLSILRLEEYMTSDGHRSSAWFAIVAKPGQ